MAGIDKAAIVFSIAIALVGVGIAAAGDSIDNTPTTTPAVSTPISESQTSSGGYGAELAAKIRAEAENTANTDSLQDRQDAAAQAAAAEAADKAAAQAAAAEAAAEAAAAEAADAEAAAAEAAEAAAMTVRDPAVDLVDTLSHSTSSGSVSSIMTNSDDATLVVAIDTSDDGELSINLDSDYITAFDDGSYFVLVNGEEAAFSQDGNDLTIPFEAGTEKIEIVGSVVVPEFGTIAMIVLAVAIVSIIAITAKTRTTLIPKL